MLQDPWDNAEREYIPRRKNSKNADAYASLPDTFGVKDVMATLDIEQAAAHKQCQRWVTHGFVERVKQGRYRKLLREIVV
jgi:predicted transcriptional regulator of viral defense system